MANPLRKLPVLKHLGTKEAMIAAAASQIGYSEVGNNDTYFGRWYGLNNQPWCGIFMSWSAFVSGNRKNIPKFAYTPAGAEYFKKKGQWGTKPRVGAIAFYDTAGLGRISHTGVVDRVFPDGSWTSIEGNTNAAGSREGRVVRRQKRRTVGTSRGGFGYPAYAPSPVKASKPAGSVTNLPKAPPQPSNKKSVTDIAREVIDGKWGTGAERRAKLEKAGYGYAAVQTKVNELLHG